ncbi:MAG TPA: hypothetical protein VFY49_06440, partial [Myxococcota bacterium]|nr:hypothetical protein [Myxococcota bacterium]
MATDLGIPREKLESLSPAQPLVDATSNLRNRLGAIPELTSLLGCNAFCNLCEYLVAMRSEECLALVQEAKRLAHDLIDRSEATRLDLRAHQLFDFIGQRCDVHARSISARIGSPARANASKRVG